VFAEAACSSSYDIRHFELPLVNQAVGPNSWHCRKSLAISLSLEVKFRYLKIRTRAEGFESTKGCGAGVVVFQNKGNGDFE
jgi:hypothetical protein